MKNTTKILLRRVLAVAITAGLSPAASAAVIDFEGYSSGTIIDNEYAPQLTVSAVNTGGGPDVAVIFDTDNWTGGDPDLAMPFDSYNPSLSDGYSPGNILIIHENFTCDAFTCGDPDDEGSQNAGTFNFNFASAITLQSIDFFSTVVQAGTNNEIRLFDKDNNELPELFYAPSTGGNNTWDRLLFGIDGVKRIELNMAGPGAIDNITYEMSTVPVPAAAWLFGSGLIGLVGVARRKNVQLLNT